MLRIVPDTNVLISAFISEGNEYKFLRLARQGKFHLILSSEILEEFNEVIARDKFGFSARQITDFNTQLLLTASEIVSPKERLKVVKDDPDDDKIIETAVEGKADYIISGDNHLLKIKGFRGIKIMNAGEFLRTL
ncbi:MAG: putative toxin-antitoxin system toxin component, PIN family [Nanoarchaeota archaeon]